MILILYLLIAIANVFWLMLLVQLAMEKRLAPYLSLDATPKSEPLVSILVPARNEEPGLQKTIESLLAQTYASVEIIIVDDHSEDRTLAIAQALAAKDSRVKVMQSGPLPPDWRGKSWALHQAAAAARGNWILMTDADVIHRPDVLRLAIATAQKERIDLLSILPHVECHTFWERVVLPAFAVILNLARPLHRANDPKSNTALAAGGFILVKSLLFRHLDGFHRIREAVAEDAKLAELFKSSGRRVKTFLAREPLITTRMYDSLAGIWEGLSRHAYEGAGYNPVRTCFIVLAAYSLMVAPVGFLVAGIIAKNSTLILLSIFPVLLMFAMQDQANRYFRIPRYYFFSFPLAVSLYGLILLNSMFHHDFGEGNTWKGRRYRKEGQVA